MPKREQLIELIACEIENIHKDAEKSGLTHWLIISALAIILWMIVNEWMIKTLVLSHILFLFYAIIFSFDVLQFIIRLVHLENIKVTRNKFYYLNEFLGANRIFLLLLWLRTFIFLITVIICRPIFPQFFNTFLIIFYGIQFIAFTIIFYLSYSEFPVSIASAISVGIYIGLALQILTLIVIIRVWWRNHVYFDIQSYHIAMLISAFYILLEKWTDIESKPILLNKLIDLRRSLYLNKINIAVAIKEFDILLYGLKISDVFQNDLNSILDMYHKIESNLNEIIIKIKAFKRKRDIHLIDDMEKLIDNINIEQKEAYNKVGKFVERLKITFVINPDVKSDVDALTKRLQNENQLISKRVNLLSIEIKELNVKSKS